MSAPRAISAIVVVLGAACPLPAQISQPGDNAVLVWDNAILQGIIDTSPGPTAAARAIAVAHTAMFDAWSAYDAVAVPTRPHRGWRRPAAEATDANKAEAVSYAAYRSLVDLFPGETAAGNGLMVQMGYDPTVASNDTSTPAGVGNLAALSVLEMRHTDGSNQLGDLHPGAYSDYTGYAPVNTPTQILDPDRWQPQLIVNSQGQIVPQTYTTPQWGLVTPFAMASGSEHRPGPPILHSDYPQYKAQADELIAISAGLTDFQKVSAEFFADGPGTYFPPGHWAVFSQFVSRRDLHTLDQDVVLFFALGNALLDASICAWDAKRAYDSVRPITAVHYIYAGQMILAWGGPFQGTKLIPGENWKPYQLGTVVTPPFPEFFSGHSVFSAAGAQILESFSGSDAFGYSVVIPKGSSRAEPGLVPAMDLTLSWATFSDCAGAAGMSRRYGGIHFEVGDLTGRSLGRVVGTEAWAKAQTFVNGTASVPLDVVPRGRSRTAVVQR